MPYVACITRSDDVFNLAMCEIDTGDFFVTSAHADFHYMLAEIAVHHPSEIVTDSSLGTHVDTLKRFDAKIVKMQNSNMYENFLDLHGVESSRCDMPGLKNTAGMLYYHLIQSQKISVHVIQTITFHTAGYYVPLDEVAQEFIGTRCKDEMGPLVKMLNQTKTEMGLRFLKEAVNKPITNILTIDRRLEIVEYMVTDSWMRKTMQDILMCMHDIPKIMGKCALKGIDDVDIQNIHQTLKGMHKIKNLLFDFEGHVGMAEEIAEEMKDGLEHLQEVMSAIEDGCAPNDILDMLFDNLNLIGDHMHHIALLDMLCGFADIAIQNKYTKPYLTYSSEEITIKNGRHPIDKNADKAKIEATILLMAYIGSFVPADSCILPPIWDMQIFIMSKMNGGKYFRSE